MTAQHPPWDDDDGDFTDFGDPSVPDAFDVYVPAQEPDDTDDPWDAPSQPVDNDDDQVLTLLFTATNPSGSVSVTVLLDGHILRADLSPTVTTMTEPQLAEEISIIANLARQQARAAQHALVVEFMRRLGHDRVATRGFLEHELGLPSPETVLAQKAHVFASRYGDDE